MNNTTELDQHDYEVALGTALAGGVYTRNEAKLLAEQRSLNWKRVKIWAGVK
jgi:hypothetical protein